MPRTPELPARVRGQRLPAGPFPSICLAIEDRASPDVVCASQNREGCRARNECSPVFWQDLGPDDGPVGAPYFDHCTDEADLADLSVGQGACSGLDEFACRTAASCQALYIVADGSPGPRFENCLEVTSPAAPAASCPQDRAGCRTRPDCVTVFEQATGPTDGAVGDPFYRRCELESIVD